MKTPSLTPSRSLHFALVTASLLLGACAGNTGPGDGSAMDVATDRGAADATTDTPATDVQSNDATSNDAADSSTMDVTTTDTSTMDAAVDVTASDTGTDVARMDTSTSDTVTTDTLSPTDVVIGRDVPMRDVPRPGDACTPATNDATAIGDRCEPRSSMCPSGYVCQPFSGIILSHSCQIRCAADCDCPMGTACTPVTDKAGTVMLCR